MKHKSLTASIVMIAVALAAFAIRAASVRPSAQRAIAAAIQPDHPSTAAQTKAPSAPNHRAQIAFAKLPMRFEANLGQSDRQVKFLSRGLGYTLFITPGEAVIAMRQNAPGGASPSRRSPAAGRVNEKKATESAVVRIALKGAASSPQVGGRERMAVGSNYFIGNDPKKWHSDVPNYAEVELKSVYPGIDLVYHGSAQARLEYDFRLAPGADPNSIRLSFKGMKKLALNEQGDLVVSVGRSQLVEHAPAIYQESAGGDKQTVAGGWKLHGAHEAGFQVARYDRSRPLVIDPLVLDYSTYLGGSGNNSGNGFPDEGNGIAVDASGDAYVTGSTTSINFPTKAGAFQSTCPSAGNLNGCSAAFVTKLNPSGSALVYSTYLGGSVVDSANAIAVDASGHAYVTGFTDSSDFPTTAGALQPTRGLNNTTATFVTKLNPSGSGLVYSTYLGGSSTDLGNGIAVDASGDAYVTGNTESLDFPTTVGAFQTHGGGPNNTFDAFVTKLNPTGTALVYSTYLGGSANDFGDAIAIDASGDAYVTGQAGSANFPTTAGAFQTTSGGGLAAFVTKLNPSGSALVYSTYLGGSAGQPPGAGDAGFGIAADASGDAYVTGQALSANFPVTAGAFQTTLLGPANAFVTKLNPSGSALVYSTFLGGSSGDFGAGIAVDASGDAYVQGNTGSADFPVTADAFQKTLDGSENFFVSKLDPSAPGAASLLYSTYLGGSGDDFTFFAGIAVDASGDAYITGATTSSNFPTLNPFQSSLAGSQNGFVAKFSASIPVTTISVPASLAFGNVPVGDTVTKDLTVKNTGTHLLFIGSVGSNDPEFVTGANTCPSGGLAHLATCTIEIEFTPSTLGLHSATLSVTDNTSSSPQHVAASGTGVADLTVTPTSHAFGSVKIGSKTTETITVHNFQTNSVSLTLPPGFSGTNAGDFTQTGGTCTSTLAKTSTCTLIVTYAPTAVGTESATMTVTDSPDTSGPYMVSFTASETIPESISATTLAFAKVAQSASKTLNVTVTNHATSGSITLTGTNVGGSSAGDFAVTGGSCGGSLGASSSCTYAVTFTPSTEAAESGSLSIGVAEDPGSPRIVNLTGTGGTPLSVLPASLAFGTVAGGHSSVNKTVTVTNNGAAMLTISESVSGVNLGDFAVTGGTCGASLAGGGSHCTYLVKFTPSTVGSESATFGVSAVGDAASPHNVSLSGTGS